MVPMLQPEMWLPLAWVEEIEPAGIQDVVPSPTGKTRIDRRGQRWLFIKARLKDGETRASAEANLQVIMAQLAAAHPKTNEKRPIAVAVERARASAGRCRDASDRRRADAWRRARSARRVRQRREHAARARLGTAEGDRHPPGDRREPRTIDPPAAHRKPRARDAGGVRGSRPGGPAAGIHTGDPTAGSRAGRPHAGNRFAGAEFQHCGRDDRRSPRRPRSGAEGDQAEPDRGAQGRSPLDEQWQPALDAARRAPRGANGGHAGAAGRRRDC